VERLFVEQAAAEKLCALRGKNEETAHRSGTILRQTSAAHPPQHMQPHERFSPRRRFPRRKGLCAATRALIWPQFLRTTVIRVSILHEVISRRDVPADPRDANRARRRRSGSSRHDSPSRWRRAFGPATDGTAKRSRIISAPRRHVNDAISYFGIAEAPHGDVARALGRTHAKQAFSKWCK